MDRELWLPAVDDPYAALADAVTTAHANNELPEAYYVYTLINTVFDVDNINDVLYVLATLRHVFMNLSPKYFPPLPVYWKNQTALQEYCNFSRKFSKLLFLQQGETYTDKEVIITEAATQMLSLQDTYKTVIQGYYPDIPGDKTFVYGVR